MGSNVIPENDITAENSVLAPVRTNITTSVEDNQDVDNECQNVVPDQPALPAPVPAPAQTPQSDPTDDDLLPKDDITDSTDSHTKNSNIVPTSKEKREH